MKGNSLLSKRNTAVAAIVLAALGVSAPAASAQIVLAAQIAPTSSAFALSAAGVLDIEPLAALDNSQGFRQTSVASAQLPDAKAPIVTVGVLNSEVDSGKARASVKDLKASLAPLGDLGVVTAESITASCVAGTGSVTLAGASVGSTALQVQPGPNTRVQVPGVLSVVLNKQTRADDGSLTVVAIAIEVAGLQKIDIASATCAQAAEPVPAPATTTTTAPQPSTSGPAASAPGKAPRPTPVAGHLAVTG